jgi:hypothetical protein
MAWERGMKKEGEYQRTGDSMTSTREDDVYGTFG